MAFCSDVEQRSHRPQSSAVVTAVQEPARAPRQCLGLRELFLSAAVMGGPAPSRCGTVPVRSCDTLSYLKRATTSGFQPGTAFGRSPVRPTSPFSRISRFPGQRAPCGRQPGRDGDGRAGRAAGPGRARGGREDAARGAGRVPGAGARGREGERGRAADRAGELPQGALGRGGKGWRGLRHGVTGPAGFGACGQRGAGLNEGWPSFVR